MTSGSTLLYYYSACLCFDLFKSLFKGCVFLCLWAAQALQEQPAEWAHLGSPQSDLQSYCIKRTVFITALHTNLLYLLHGEHNPFLKLKCSSTQHFQKLFRHDWLVESLKEKPIAWLLWEVKMVFRSHWKFNQSVICLFWTRTDSTGQDCYWLQKSCSSFREPSLFITSAFLIISL